MRDRSVWYDSKNGYQNQGENIQHWGSHILDISEIQIDILSITYCLEYIMLVQMYNCVNTFEFRLDGAKINGEN